MWSCLRDYMTSYEVSKDPFLHGERLMLGTVNTEKKVLFLLKHRRKLPNFTHATSQTSSNIFLNS